MTLVTELYNYWSYMVAWLRYCFHLFHIISIPIGVRGTQTLGISIHVVFQTCGSGLGESSIFWAQCQSRGKMCDFDQINIIARNCTSSRGNTGEAVLTTARTASRESSQGIPTISWTYLESPNLWQICKYLFSPRPEAEFEKYDKIWEIVKIAELCWKWQIRETSTNLEISL